jgi:hypothetical protein
MKKALTPLSSIQEVPNFNFGWEITTLDKGFRVFSNIGHTKGQMLSHNRPQNVPSTAPLNQCLLSSKYLKRNRVKDGGHLTK